MKKIILPGDRRFHINRKRYAEVEAHIDLIPAGFFSGRAIRADGSVRAEFGLMDSNPNLLTNLGLNSFATGNYAPNPGYIHLGTGTTPPNVNDTALVNYGTNIGTSPHYPNQARSIQSASPYFCTFSTIWKSAIGGATGVWTELGVSNQAATGNLSSRALFLDSGGNPASFPVLADEQLEVTYQLRFYMPESDAVASIMMGAGSHDTTTRSAYVTQLNKTVGWWPSWMPFVSERPDGNVAYTGAIGAITSFPGGSYLGEANSYTADAYGHNNFYRDFNYTFNAGTATGAIRSLLTQTPLSCFQTEYDPVLNKVAAELIVFKQRVSWARR